MNLEKIWNHPAKQKVKKQIEEDIFADSEMIETSQDKSAEKTKDKIFKLQNTDDILRDVSRDDLYSWYSNAMSRRNREPLQEESFNYHFFESGSYDETSAYGEKDKGYLLGFNKFNVFTPTHFAPKTLRGGYELFQALGESDQVPAILAITEDLADTLKKIPSWHKLDIKEEVLSYFRGELVKKEIYYNSHPEVENLMFGLLMEYMNQRNDNNDDYNEDYSVDEFLDSDN